jgi:hypothetical protein
MYQSVLLNTKYLKKKIMNILLNIFEAVFS